MTDMKKYLLTPLEVIWDITRRCNLSCPFCLEDSLDASCPENVSEEQRWLIVSEIVKCRVLNVNITGGEPFLMPRLEEYVQAMVDGGCRVSITSNGLLITKERAEKLALSGIDRVDITVYPEVMTQSFQSIEYLLKAGIKVLPRAVFTRQMRDSLDEFLASCKKAGLKQLEMQEVVPVGRALRDFHSYKLSEEEVVEAIKVITDYKDRQEDFSVGFSSTTLAECESQGATYCGIPTSMIKKCEIRPDGNVIPCSLAIVYGIDNNIFTKGLKQCWLDMQELYGNVIANSVDGYCLQCAAKEDCPGGCPAEHEEWARRGVSSPAKYCRFFVRKEKK